MNRMSLFWGEIQIVCKVSDCAALMAMGWTKLPVERSVAEDPEPDYVASKIIAIPDKDTLKVLLESEGIFIDYRGSLETVKTKAVEAWKQRAQS